MAKAVPKLPAPRTVTRMIASEALYINPAIRQAAGSSRHTNDDFRWATVVAVAISPAHDQCGAPRGETQFRADDSVTAYLRGSVGGDVRGPFSIVERTGVDGVVG